MKHLQEKCTSLSHWVYSWSGKQAKQTAAAYVDRGKSYKNVWVSEFIQDMDKAYAAADAVISRAGAMTVAELCCWKTCCVCALSICSRRSSNGKCKIPGRPRCGDDGERQWDTHQAFSSITVLKGWRITAKFKSNISKYCVKDAAWKEWLRKY